MVGIFVAVGLDPAVDVRVGVRVAVGAVVGVRVAVATAVGVRVAVAVRVAVTTPVGVRERAGVAVAADVTKLTVVLAVKPHESAAVTLAAPAAALDTPVCATPLVVVLLVGSSVPRVVLQVRVIPSGTR